MLKHVKTVSADRCIRMLSQHLATSYLYTDFIPVVPRLVAEVSKPGNLSYLSHQSYLIYPILSYLSIQLTN